MKNLAASLAALAVAVTFTAACGGNGGRKAAPASRTVDIEMHDIKYEPSSVQVKAGETVRFVFHNAGQIDHDAYIGDEAAQMGHEKEMKGMGGMHKSTADAITVAPGKTGELTHTFTKGQSVLIGCHQPGHYAAGMKVTVDVT
ncbi:MAG TPA: plastocyanin/azurin family copper-binding protein [Acidimicrobiia bacterium]|nr:plastocyanin/azurin family copper-binding protein [Acidimicrobiia bacterium]